MRVCRLTLDRCKSSRVSLSLHLLEYLLKKFTSCGQRHEKLGRSKIKTLGGASGLLYSPIFQELFVGNHKQIRDVNFSIKPYGKTKRSGHFKHP